MTHFHFAFSPKDSIVEQTFSVGREGAIALGGANFNFSLLNFPKMMEDRGFPEVTFLLFWYLKKKLMSHSWFSTMMDACSFSEVTFSSTWFCSLQKFYILSTPCREVANWGISLEMMDSDFGEHLKGFSIKDIWEREYCVNSIKGMYMGSSGESTPQMDRWILTILVVKKNGRLIVLG